MTCASRDRRGIPRPCLVLHRDVAHLFDPLTLRNVSFRNRVWMSPMCQYSVFDLDGVPTDWHLVHLGTVATGGAGLVMTEATAVGPEGRISDHDTGIWNDEQARAWARIAGFIHDRGATAGIQLAHAGRKGSTWTEWGVDQKGTQPRDAGGWQTVSASGIAFGGFAPPVPLDEQGLDTVVTDFAAAAARARDAGFDVVEVHAAHGYLLHQFLSPLSNSRTDAYGGSLKNRARLLLRVVRAVRAAIGDGVALFVRFSATDWVEGGWDVAQTSTVAGWAREAGADLFDVSSGGLVADPHIPTHPGYQVPFAAEVRRATGAPVNALGLITDAVQAEQIVATGQADAVMMGRQLSRDPHFALRAAHELGVDPSRFWPPQYHRSHWR